MSKSKELINTTAIVKDVMSSCPEARNNDDYLILTVCKRINPLCAELSFETVLKYRKMLGLPVFETIRRTGQKVREARPELAGSSAAEASRVLSEQAFRDYARKKTV